MAKSKHPISIDEHRVVPRDDSELAPFRTAPWGMTGGGYQDVGGGIGGTDGDRGDAENPNLPPDVPTGLRVVSQETKIGDDGRSVVDVVIEFDGIDDAVSYEVRFYAA